MISLNSEKQPCKGRLLNRLHGAKKTNVTLQQLSLILCKKWVVFDESVKKACEKKRKHERRCGRDYDPRLSAFKKNEFVMVNEEEAYVKYEPYQVEAAEYVLFLLGFLAATGIEDIEYILKDRLERMISPLTGEPLPRKKSSP